MNALENFRLQVIQLLSDPDVVVSGSISADPVHNGKMGADEGLMLDSKRKLELVIEPKVKPLDPNKIKLVY